MSFTRSSLLAVIAAGALATPAVAAQPAPPPPGPDGIIAILIGLVKPQPFTPPIGTNHGS